MHTEAQEHEVEELACSVLESGNVKYQLYRNQRTAVDVTELTLRLRETPRDVKRTTTRKTGPAAPICPPVFGNSMLATLTSSPHGCIRLIRAEALSNRSLPGVVVKGSSHPQRLRPQTSCPSN
jgi:hypothetical protein